MSGSRDTILRLIRTVEPPATVPPKKVGVDDWAWKRGHRYGTLFCDLERAQVIALLPDRSEESVTAWFAAHPSIELISRDGSSTYAAAALKGAPQAIQILDTWHLVKNLAKALQVLFTSHLTAHRKKKTQEAGLQKEFASFPEPERRLSPQQARIQGVHREERLARLRAGDCPGQARDVSGFDRTSRGCGPQHGFPMAASRNFSRTQATRTSQSA